MTEINALRSGDMDAQLLGELRGILGKKYGKKNLDAWVPEAVDVKQALTDGDVEMVDAVPEDKEPVVQTEVEEPVAQAVDASEEAVLEAMASPAPVPEAEQAEDIGVVTVPGNEDDTVAIVTEEDANKNSAFDEEPDYPEPGPDPAETIAQATGAEADSSSAPKKGRGRPTKVSRRNTKARTATPVASPTPTVEDAPSPARSELSPAPGSDLSPAPSPSPVKDEPTRGTKRKARPSSKAAAAVQPPAKSRAPRGTAAAAAVAAASPASTTVPDSEMTSDAGEEEEDGKAKPLRETRGRRGKQAQSNPVSSPPPSKARGSSPPAVKRAGSASSQGPDDTVATPRTSRRTAKDRKGVDNTSKLSISNTAEDEDNEEQVKEEEEETEPEKPTRSNEKKKKKGAPATAAETPVATRTSNRRESARGQ